MNFLHLACGQDPNGIWEKYIIPGRLCIRARSFIRIWEKYIPGRLLRPGRLLILGKSHTRTIIRDRTIIREIRVNMLSKEVA